MRRFGIALACPTHNLFERQVRMRKDMEHGWTGILKGELRFALFNP